MTEKLKTLKDIMAADEFDRNKFSVRYGKTKLYSEELLRKAAIEWGKRAMEQMENTKPEEGEPISTDFAYWSGQKNLICLFFDITEEDLK